MTLEIRPLEITECLRFELAGRRVHQQSRLTEFRSDHRERAHQVVLLENIAVDGKRGSAGALDIRDYGGSFRAFVLEVDRGTEPLTSPNMRKSVSASIAAYAAAQQTDRLRTTYGLKAPVIVLWVFNAKARAEFALEQISRLPPSAKAAHLVQWEAHDLPVGVCRNDYFSQPWSRADIAPISLGTP